METITIKNSKKISRNVFEDWNDLLNFIKNQLETDENIEFSDDFKAELDKREEELISGKTEGIPWRDVKKEMLSRIK